MTQTQKQIAEQIAEKHLGKKNWQRYGTLQRQGVIAAIVEALSLQGNAPRWVKASEAPYNTWVLLGNEHFIGVAKRLPKEERENGEPEWHDEIREYLDVNESFYYMPLPEKPNKPSNNQTPQQ
jgi:hypothetical protein